MLLITGPRQSGKTTLARETFPERQYFNLEDIELRESIKKDPKAFLRRHYREKIIIDEIQRIPELVSYIQIIVDENEITGQFVLTGSQNFQILDTMSQSLAGRSAQLTLLPLSLNELDLQSITPELYSKYIYSGFYPRLQFRNLPAEEFYANYVSTYIERDLRQFKEIRNLALFQKFLRICATRIGSLVNLSNISNDLGISSKTLREWLTLLEASYIVFLLNPYHSNNLTKRLIKSPKLYFYDVGLASYLLGIDSEKQVEKHFLYGSLFENMVIIELLKQRFNTGKKNNLYFYRDSRGNEVDVIIENAETLTAIEIKSTETIKFDKEYGLEIFSGLDHINSALANQIKQSCLIYRGDRTFTINEYLITNLTGFTAAQ